MRKQQGGFASAVEAEDTNLGTIIEAEGDIAQDLLIWGMDAADAHHGIDDLSV